MKIKKLKPDASKEEMIKYLNFLVEKVAYFEKRIDDIVNGYTTPYDDTLDEYDENETEEQEEE